MTTHLRASTTIEKEYSEVSDVVTKFGISDSRPAQTVDDAELRYLEAEQRRILERKEAILATSRAR